MFAFDTYSVRYLQLDRNFIQPFVTGHFIRCAILKNVAGISKSQV